MGLSRKKAVYYNENIKNLSVKIPWRYFRFLLIKHRGFDMVPAGKTSGAKRAFVQGEVRFTVDEPHRGKDENVDKTGRNNAIRAIEMLEALD